MRITILQGAFLPVPPLLGGAVEKLWFQLGKEFARSGHDVVHISRMYPGLAHLENIDSVRHIRIPGFDIPSNAFLLKLFDFLYSLRALLNLPASDILITNTFFAPILIRLLFCSSRKVVVDVERMPKGQLFLYKHVAALRCCSTAVLDHAVQQCSSLSRNAVVVPNPLPFIPDTSEVPPSKQPVILYCGRVHPEKGIELLLRAFLILRQSGFDEWSLRIVGPIDIHQGGGGISYQRRLEAIALSSSLDIEWVGPLYDDFQLHAEYRRASIFVYPSLAEHGEAFGVAPLEAMAHGAVPIVSSLSCFSDFIKHGYNGCIFNHRAEDPVFELANSIQSLIERPSYRKSLSLHALHVRESHHPAAISDQLIQLFSSLSNKAPAP